MDGDGRWEKGLDCFAGKRVSSVVPVRLRTTDMKGGIDHTFNHAQARTENWDKRKSFRLNRLGNVFISKMALALDSSQRGSCPQGNQRGRTGGPSLTVSPAARASHPTIREISWTNALVSRAFVVLSRSWESLAWRHGWVETWTFEGRDD